MIELYARGTADFSKSGIRIHPSEAEVSYTENGQWDMEMTMPAAGDYTEFDYGQILRVSVPYQHLNAITLGEVSYYTVSNSDGTKIYGEVPKTTKIKYSPWTLGKNYGAGTKVTSGGHNYECTSAHYSQPQNAPGSGPWSRIADTSTFAGTTVAELTSGTVIMKVGDFNDEYMEAATTTGYQGYIKIADCTATGETGTRTIPARTIRTQLFVVTEVQKNQAKQTIRVSAEHISYQLGRTMLGECNVVNVTPATAMMFIMGAMKEEYTGNFYTDITGDDYLITGDWSWKNAQSAILDPNNGLVQVTGAQLIRDNMDVIILAEAEDPTPSYTVRYGANMKDVTWKGNVDNLITRIYPTAKTEDGRTLLLPEEHIDTARSVPFIRPEVLNTGLQVGKEEENTDGTTTELTEDDVFIRMREKARERFTVDKVDRAEVSLELDWLHMPDTAEYQQYSDLKNVAPGEYVLVYSAPLGVNEKIRMTGYVWDPITETYKSGKFGMLKVTPTVAGYNIATSAVSATHIASNSISGEHIMANSITAREIEAGSITADRIASKTITADLIEAKAITADEIAANTITAEEIAANTITASEIAAHTITATEIAAHTITATEIAAHAITADQIEAHTITANEIAANTITSDRIAAHTITSDRIAAHTITADEIASHTITADEIAAGAITATAIEAHTITADQIASNTITANEIASHTITADEIAGGSITATEIAAHTITADQIEANTITADEIATGAINADKIDATDLSAINAKLGTANIASAVIASADINYAHIKDLSADEAIFTTTITETGVADRLYINRLLITYGQMVEATIGDLVIGASDGYYYHVDVEWDEDEVPTLVPTRVESPSAAEIAAGHTSEGKTIIGNIGTFAELSSEEFYAINSIIDRITARRIDVDELWARQAFIDKLMVQDISSNTYIQSTIGNWQSQSTITQTVAGLESRISSLGYGTIYYSTTEPAAAGLVQGDIWVQPLEDHVWQEYTAQEWQDILDGGDWGSVMGAYKVYTWSGQYWKTLFDSTVNTEMWTAIEQNTAAIAMKASQSDLNILSGEISTFEATLTVQAQEISAAVSAVNTKASTYVMWADPHTVYTVTLGDIWVKSQENFGSWLDTKRSTWQTIKGYKWKDALGGETYVWDGSEWVMTSDRASEIYQETQINQTAQEIQLLATSSAMFQDQLITMRSELKVQSDRITAEVSQLTAAEGILRQKTQFLMTSGLISLEAFTDGTAGTAMGVITKAGISIDASGKINISALSSDARNAISKAAGIEVDGSGKIKISAMETDGKNAIEKAAGITVDSSGKIVISALETSAGAAINKAAGIEVNGSGKIVINALETDAVSAINKSAGIEVNSSGKIVINAMESNAVTAINKAAGITVNSSGKITISALATDAQNAINKAASIEVDASGKILISALQQDAQNAIDKAANISVNSNGKITIDALETDAKNAINKAAGITVNSSGKIKIEAMETNAQNAINKAAGITVNSSGKIKIESLESNAQNAINKAAGITVTNGKVTLSAAYFDSLGSNSSNVYITPTQVKIQSNSFVVSSTNFSLTSSGVMTAKSGTLGGWSFSDTRLESGSDTGYVRLNSKTTDTYAIICGSETAASAPFRVKRDGSVTLTKLMTLRNGQEVEVNLQTAGLWKLSGETVVASSSNSISLSNGATINFIRAADLRAVVDGTPSAAETDIPIRIYYNENGDSTEGVLDVAEYHDIVHEDGANSVSISSVTGGAYSTAAHVGMVYVTLSNGVTRAQSVSFTQY